MSQDKEQRTENATPRRRKKARDEGQVARSQDISSVATLIGGMGVLAFTGLATAQLSARHTIDVLAHLDSSTPMGLIGEAGEVLVLMALPACLASAAAALIVGFGQAGWRPTFKPLVPNLQRMDPIKKLKQMFFSPNSLVEVLKALAKIAIVGGIVGGIIYGQIVGATAWTAATVSQVLERTGEVVFDISWRAALAMILLAMIDYAWQRHRFEESIKMTKQEVKDEHKEVEGDPHIKGKRRQRMRDMSNQRVQAVAEAAVVVVNPTHVAVALRYQPPEDGAPVVIAKGVDEGARKVREEARRHQVPIHHDPPLARQLARRVPIGRPVPPDTYRAVAAVLAAVLKPKTIVEAAS